MGYARRSIFVKGLGTFALRRLEPTAETAPSKVGFLQDFSFMDEHGMVEVRSDVGHLINVLSGSQKVFGVANLQQTSKEEIDIPVNAVAQAHVVQYYGPVGTGKWQYFLMQLARLIPAVDLKFASATVRILPIAFAALKDTEPAFDAPVYFLVEREGEIRMDDLQLWTDPRQGGNLGTAYLLDISGWNRNGTIAPVGDVAAIWQTSAAPYFLRLDGTDDQVSYGNVLNDDASGDFVIECWMKFPASGALEEVLTKKSACGDNTAGFAIYKIAANTIRFEIASGSAAVTVTTTNTVANTWKHFAVTVDRNGNAQAYLNGVTDGAPASVAAIATGTNALNLYLGRDAANFGRVDLGGVRIYRMTALPSTIGTTIATHYAAERAYYGV